MSPLGRRVTVTIDRPRGSAHPERPDLLYPIDYGSLPGTLTGDGAPQHAYVLGGEASAPTVEGVVVAVVERADATPSPWVVALDGRWRSAEEIAAEVAFLERFYDSRVRVFPWSLVATDMDDTLLGPDHAVSPENIAAIERLKALGVRIVLASGRRHENLERFYKDLGLSGPAVSGNGALVRDTDTGDDWYEKLLPEDLALELLAEGAARGVTQVVEHRDGGSYLKEATAYSEILAFRTGNPLTPVGDLVARGGAGLRKILWIAPAETVAALKTELDPLFSDRLCLQITDPEYLEFMAAGVNKVHALEVVAQRLGIDATQVLALGDGGNDVLMLRWAGFGVAMAHGWQSAREAADRVAPSGEKATAFARAIDELCTAAAPETEVLDTRITGLAVGGAAVGRVVGPEGSPRVGIAAFVPLAAPGELVRTRVAHAYSRHVDADLLSILEASPARTEPPCPHFGACGGCDLQHLTYDAQLTAKHAMVLGALQAGGLGELARLVAPVTPGPPLAYRQRVVLQLGGDGQPGFFRRRSHDLLPVRACPVATEPIQELLAEGLTIDGASEGATLLVESGENGLFGVLRTDAPAEALDLPALTEQLAARFVGGAIVAAGRGAARFGEGAVQRTVDGARVEMAPGGFAQANASVNEALVAAVCAAAEAWGAQTACDLYAGSGNFALALAARGVSTTAVESVKPLVAVGRAEAKRRDLPVRFVEEKVEGFVRRRPERVGLIVADPPRAGLDKVASRLLFGRGLALVSCHVPSAVRDLKALRTAGWKVESITPFDMFAQTGHVELLTLLRR